MKRSVLKLGLSVVGTKLRKQHYRSLLGQTFESSPGGLVQLPQVSLSVNVGVDEQFVKVNF